MTALSKTLSDQLYNAVLRATNYTAPTTVYLALHDSGGAAPAHPGKTEALAFGNEVDYTSYQRQAITFDAPAGTENAQGSNSAAVTFPAVDIGTADFNVTGLSIWSAERGANVGASGQLLLAGPIDALKEMAEDDVPLIPVGSLSSVFGSELP